MCKTVVQQVAALEDGVHERQTGRGAVPHRHGNGAVQLDDGRRIRPPQHVVEADDFRPVRGGGGGRLGVHGRDCGLNRVRAEASRRERLLHEPDSLGNLMPVPERAVLILEQDHIARQ